MQLFKLVDFFTLDTEYFQVAITPMITESYQNLREQAVSNLSINFPFFFLFTFILPLYYLVARLAEEKESKAREGMKMMGLTDFEYLSSWFVFFLVLILVVSGIITLVVSFNVFPKSIFFVFLFCFLYCLTLFGSALIVV